MAKRLKFSRIDLVERVGALMLVSFLDDEGNMYNWAPKWADVKEIFQKQINVERFNKPESEWLNKFAKTAQEIVEGAQRIDSAYKVSGKLERYEDGKLVITYWTDISTQMVAELTPGFEVTLDFLDNWLEREVDAFVVNDIVIQLRVMRHGVVQMEYPEPEEEEEEGTSEDDIPF